MNISTFVLTLLFLIGNARLCASPDNRPTFENIIIPGTSSVYCFAYDRHGTVWMGTDCGLYSYDGYNTYPHFRLKTEENTRIHSIYIIGETIYLGTDNGLFLFDIRHERYLTVPGNTPKDIRAIAFQDGKLWLGSSEGLFSYHLSDHRLVRKYLSLPYVYTLLPTSRGLLVGTIYGLSILKGDSYRTLKLKEGRQPLVNVMLKDSRKAGVWIGTEGALYYYDWNKFIPIASLDGNSVKSLVMSNGQLYVGTDNGLYVADERGSVSHLTHDSRDKESIINNIVWGLASDQWNNIWVGTDNGFSLNKPNSFSKFIPLNKITGSGDGNCFHALLREPDGTLWMGGTNGLIRCTYINGSPGETIWFRQKNHSHPFSHNRVRKIYLDSKGNLLVCTDQGINVYDRRRGQFRNYVVYDNTERYSTSWAYDIVEDRQGRYWIASYMGGIFVIERDKLLQSDGKVVADRHFLNELQGIHVGQLAINKDASYVYAQLYKRGLDRIDTRTMRVSHILDSNNPVNFLLADSSGNIWTGMDGKVCRFGYNPSERHVYRIGGNENKHVSTMIDVKNQVWCIMGNECSVFRPDGSSSRFMLDGFLPLAGWYDNTTRQVLLGGNDGLMRIDVAAVDSAVPSARVNLSAVFINGKPFELQGEADRYLRKLVLGSDENSIVLRLTDIPFSGRLKRVYAYQLEGVNRDWQYLQDGNLEISYNGLPHGNYRLRVCAVDGNGRAGQEVYSLSIRILPPWYLSLWAKLLYAAAFVGLCVWIMKFYLIKEQMRKERRDKQRVLEQSKARSDFFANLSAQLRIPLRRILSHIYALLPDEADIHRGHRLDEIRKGALSVNELVYKALDISSAATDEKPGKAEMRMDMVDFCRRMAEDIGRDGKMQKVEIVFQTNITAAYIDFDMARFQPLMYALARYALECTPEGGQVFVNLQSDTNPTALIIEINAPGMTITETDLPFVFNRYHTKGQNAGLNDDRDNDLASLREYMETHNGTITAASLPEGGTIFTVAFSVNDNPKWRNIPGNSTSTVQKWESRADSDSKLLSEITTVIESHIADSEFNVTRLQELVGIGEKLLYRRIKQHTGQTPVELIRNIRMRHASLLLREGRFSVSEVMYMVGFSNSGYFSKCFKKVYGITPADYARRKSGGENQESWD